MKRRIAEIINAFKRKPEPRLGEPSIEFIVYSYMNDMFDEAERIGAQTDARNGLIKSKVAARVIEDLLIYISTLNENEPFLAKHIYNRIIHKVSLQSALATITVVESEGGK